MKNLRKKIKDVAVLAISVFLMTACGGSEPLQTADDSHPCSGEGPYLVNGVVDSYIDACTGSVNSFNGAATVYLTALSTSNFSKSVTTQNNGEFQFSITQSEFDQLVEDDDEITLVVEVEYYTLDCDGDPYTYSSDTYDADISVGCEWNFPYIRIE